ncbi:hypothetical protein [Planococcus soli]|uniref:hypothetical protein n=1 Tax=Planococcus soli TaxID=2666072 RepID=UPI00115D5541|nr:hypothetical protein [Planococcus soli]
MQKVFTERGLGITIAVIIFLGIIIYTMLDSLEVIYFMVTAIILAGILYEKDRKKNIWKYIVGYAILIGFIYILFS